MGCFRHSLKASAQFWSNKMFGSPSQSSSEYDMNIYAGAREEYSEGGDVGQDLVTSVSRRAGS